MLPFELWKFNPTPIRIMVFERERYKKLLVETRLEMDFTLLSLQAQRPITYWRISRCRLIKSMVSCSSLTLSWNRVFNSYCELSFNVTSDVFNLDSERSWKWKLRSFLLPPNQATLQERYRWRPKEHGQFLLNYLDTI